MDNELSVVLKTQLEDANKKLDQLINGMNQGAKATNNLTSSVEGLKHAFNFSAVMVTLKKTFNIIKDGIDLINSYSETLNMFNLVMGDVQEQASKFQTTMATNFGNNSQEQLYYQSLYQSLTESMGIQEKYAYIISENMTKLAYDLSSLYDKNQKDVAEALRSGLIGQTKPVRAFGLDITEASLQPILDSLGIDRTVRELSQAEKEIVRYLALIRQSVIAHGDMANTIESPANQLRILKNQLVECHRWFGALFINLFAKAMPFINGFVMAITEVMKALGGLFGIEIQDYNSALVSYEEELGNYIDDVGDSADSTKNKIKELRREILKFDQINNINENKDSGSGSSFATGSGGIDQRLLDALSGYENGMEKVRMKALEIKDAIMKWLGYTYDTTEGVWKLKDGLTNIEKIGIAITGIIGVIVASKLAKWIGNIATLLGVGTNSLGALLPATKLKIGLLATGLVGLVTSTIKGYDSIKKLSIEYSKIDESMRNTSEALKINNELWKKFGILMGETVVSGALIGAMFGPWGALIGGIAGAIVGLTSAFLGVKSAMKEVAIAEAFGDIELTTSQLEEITSNIGANMETQIGVIKNYKNEISGLESTWKSSIETVGQYGIMYGVMKKQVSEESIPTIIKSIEELGKNTKDIIKNSTSYSFDLWSSMMTNSTSVTEEEKKNILNAILDGGSSAEAKVDEIQNNITETYKHAIATRGYLTDEEYKYINSQLELIRDITKASMSNSKTDLELIQKDIDQGRLDLTHESYEKLIKKIKEKEQEASDEAWEIRRLAYQDAEKNKIIQESAGKSAEEVARIYADSLKIADENYDKTLTENKKIVSEMYSSIEKTIENKRKELISNAKWEETDWFGTKTAKKKYSSEEKILLKCYDEMLKNIRNYKKDVEVESKKAGENAVQGQIDGMNSKKKDLETTTTKIFEMVPDTSKKVLDEHSPSKVLETIGKNTILGYINGLNSQSNNLTKTAETLINSVKKKFDNTKLSLNISTNIEGSLNSILSKVETFVNRFRNAINSMLYNMTTSMNNVKVGGDNRLYYTAMPYISVPRFANGGFPEDGFFYANHHEMVGQFSNGKTAVANNEQITEGIKRAVVQGMSQALRNSGYSTVKLDIRQDEGIIVKTAIEGINNITKQTGENPIELW